MDKTNEIYSKVRKFYIEKSMRFQHLQELKKTLQSMAIALLFFENNLDEKYVLRDTRNMLYEMSKEIIPSEGKKLIKEMIKLIK